MSGAGTTAGPVVVTGATGFVGRHLVRSLLDAGHRVAVLQRPASDLSPLADAAADVHSIVDTGDTRALHDELARFAPSTLVHLATHYVAVAGDDDIAALYEANVVFGGRVAHAFAASGGRSVIYTSTFSQHRGGAPFDPTNLYAATKQAFADVLLHYARNAGLTVVDLELFDTFGPGDPRTKIWRLLTRAATTGEPLPTTPGNQLLSPLHVTDAAAALRQAVEVAAGTAEGYHAYSAPGPRVLSLRDAVALFAEVNGVDVPVTWGARDYSGNEVFEMTVHGPQLPGWVPEVSLETGFRELWQEATERTVDR
jgi:nucleoside-diphosphate-sugar epimerase